MKIELPDGGWASLRDPEMVTERQRRPLMKAVMAAGPAEGSAIAEVMSEVSDALVLALVESWSLDTEVSADSLLDLPSKTYDALAAACQPLMQAILPDFSPTPDPESPSAPSNV